MNRRDTDELIDRLTRDRPFPGSILPAGWITFLWFFLALVYITSCLLLFGPFRPGWTDQILAHPRFGVELVAGLGASLLFALAGFRLAIPGLSVRLIQLAGLFLLLIWLGSFMLGVGGFPAIEGSMLGKREGCVREALILSVPPLMVALFLIRRRFVLHPVRTAASLAGATAIIPAALMQISCMYDPVHIITHHVFPAALVLTMVVLIVALFPGIGIRNR
jgi:hypothetical protein